MKTETNHTEKSSFAFQKLIVLVSIFLFAVKLLAWYLTQSVAIYSDAMESIVNIVSSALGLYSLYLSTQPRDSNHPYGHGKIELLSSAVEGVLIGIAGIIIMLEAGQSLYEAHPVYQLDWGIILVAFSALVNVLMGWMAIRLGRKNNSLALKSTGKHLLSDTWSTLGIIIGLILLYFTDLAWIDSAVAFIFALVILYTAYQIIRESVSGMMDEADMELIREIVELLQNERVANWIDLHNLRVIKYGNKLHLDLHMTLPFYLSVQQAHDEVDRLDDLMNHHFADRVELFVHTDPCMPFSCKICTLANCPERRQLFDKAVVWNVKNVSENSKHQVPD